MCTSLTAGRRGARRCVYVSPGGLNTLGKAPPCPRAFRAIQRLFEIMEEFCIGTLIDPRRRGVAVCRVLLRGRGCVFDTEHALEVMFENHRLQYYFYCCSLTFTHAGKALELMQELLVCDVCRHHGLTLVKEQVIGRDVKHLDE